MTEPKRSTKYYQDTVIFLVENTLFKVAKCYFMEHSEIFSDMFDIPQSKGHVADGSSDEHPLVLEDVTAKDFETLLGLMYPPKEYLLPLARQKWEEEASRGPVPSRAPSEAEVDKIRRAGIERYVPCVKLARRWLLHQIHAECIARLDDPYLTPVDRVVLGKELHVASWIRTGYRTLVERKDKLSKEEAVQIGPLSTLGVCNLREERSDRRGDPSHFTIVNLNRIERKREAEVKDDEHIAAIEEIFKEELSFAEQMDAEFYADVE